MTQKKNKIVSERIRQRMNAVALTMDSDVANAHAKELCDSPATLLKFQQQCLALAYLARREQFAEEASRRLVGAAEIATSYVESSHENQTH